MFRGPTGTSKLQKRLPHATTQNDPRGALGMVLSNYKLPHANNQNDQMVFSNTFPLFSLSVFLRPSWPFRISHLP